MGDEGQGFARFGMLDLVEQDGREQHRIDAVPRRLTVDVALQRSQLIEGACPERLKLVNAAGEQLGQGCLWSVNPEPPLKHPQFFSGEIRWITLLGDGLLRVFFRRVVLMVLPGQKRCRTGEKSHACQQ